MGCLHDEANIKQTWSKHKANVLNIHVHDMCSKFASCEPYRIRVNQVRRSKFFQNSTKYLKRWHFSHLQTDRVVLYTIEKLSASAFKRCNCFYAKINNLSQNKHYRSGPLLFSYRVQNKWVERAKSTWSVVVRTTAAVTMRITMDHV